MSNKMRNFLVIFSIFTVTLLFTSCPADGNGGFYVPQAVLLDFSVANEMDAPITVKIRHKYSWGMYMGYDLETATLYSEWSAEYNINSGESKQIGVEKTMVSDANSSWELEGFILLDEIFRYDQRSPFLSSFDLKIITTDNTIVIPGYTEISESSNDTEICVLKIITGFSDTFCHLNTNKQDVMIEVPFVLPVTLTINPDGTYSFDHETIEEGKGIIVFKRE